MSAESYCCYLVCCSFDSLLEQSVEVCWNSQISLSLLSQLSKSVEIDGQASPVSRLWRVPYHVMMLYPAIVPRHVFQ